MENEPGGRHPDNGRLETLFLTTEQVKAILTSSGKDVKWELTKAKDSKHVHHICKVWRST